MSHSPSPKFLVFALQILLYFAPSPSQAQDAVQIVARAALCFDNRPVINSCLTSMGILTTNGTSAASGKNSSSSNTTTISGGISPSSAGPKQNKRNSTSVLCGSPCYGQMMMMAGCVDGIMSSFQFYSPGLLQGVQAVFQMACRGSNTTTTNSTAFSSSSSSSHVARGGAGASNGGNVILRPMLMFFLLLVGSLNLVSSAI